MNIAFYLAAAVALVSTVMVITRTNAVHALLYMVLSLLSVASARALSARCAGPGGRHSASIRP